MTPVPGGVGPCTVACLMANTLRYLPLIQGAHENILSARAATSLLL